MDVKERVQERFQCCGFQSRAPENGTAEHPSCQIVDVSPNNCYIILIL